MSVFRLVAREILHRKLNFALGMMSVFIATGCLVAELTLLRAHDLRTAQVLREKQAEAEARLKAMEDDYRKIMKAMGFNILILPDGQDLSDFWARGYATRTMPEAYVKKLAESRIMSIRHLLPILEQRVTWPERKRTINLVGTRGEAPLLHRDPKKPILVAVPPGKAVLGYELWHGLGLKVGDGITFRGRDFTVATCHAERGTVEDITMWIDLAQAQQLLGRAGRINAIQALRCHCTGMDLSLVRREIARVLPGAIVKEMSGKAVARAQARDRAKKEHEEALASEQAARGRLRRAREAFAAVLVPLVIIGCTAWVGVLAFTNVRERRGEIGILRAIGLRSRQIMLLFLARAALVGLAGAVLGCIGGVATGAAWGEPGAALQVSALLMPDVLLLVIVAAPVLSGVAGWVPAMMAGRQDPAVVLSEE